MPWSKQEMADEVIELFTPGASVNLGIGMPGIVAQRIPKKKDIIIHSENGVLGVSGRPSKNELSPTLINAGKESIAIEKGASFFDSALSFGMIRGGHMDFSVLGGMQVDLEGSLANWMVPGKKIMGMGGAMDLVHGAKTVIVMMSHFDKLRRPKLVEKCDLPLTGFNVTDFVVTEFGVFRPSSDKFTIHKLAQGHHIGDLGIDGLIKH